MKQYNTTFIIDGSLEQEKREKLIGKFEKTLKKFGGALDNTVRWGLRKLAYEINKCTQGYYVIFYYSAESSVIKKFESEMRLNEYILRYMTLIHDGKHPEYIQDEGKPSAVSKKTQEKEKIPEIDSEDVADMPSDEAVEAIEAAEDTSDTDETADAPEVEENMTESESADEPIEKEEKADENE